MIQLARFLERAIWGVNGPGERSVVWVQGCPFRCPGCFNPRFLEFGDHPHVRAVSEAQVVAMVLKEHARKPLDGVTFSGGEPMAQAEGLAIVARQLREQGLSVLVFTGYPYDHLLSNGTPAMRQLLEVTDLVVAGPFVQRLKNWRPGVRGSTNQQAIYLTDRITKAALPEHPVEHEEPKAHVEESEELKGAHVEESEVPKGAHVEESEVPRAHVELLVGDDGRVHMTGFPSQQLRDALRDRFEEDG